MKVPLTRLTLPLAALAVVAVLATFLVVALRFNSLPETIPVHFGLGGAPDGWSSRRDIWELPVVSLMLLVIQLGAALLAIRLGPRQHPKTVELTAMFASWCAVVFLVLAWRAIEVAVGHAESLGWYTIAVIFVPLIGLIIRSLQVKRISVSREN
ncbi:MAG TPA: DUF1648 domain-containing protein [Candidatus Krumholzibacteria bacterium]|nr:DUF1648 domain-containing protein [Candidatus Krumholzibacteria bacterium]